jgi:RimJ/RimL family protein N-acetyltransferase|tara:strand:- start:2675 stop:2989 length:315 start_codon:yes stop_codon:yes gene_type:complete
MNIIVKTPRKKIKRIEVGMYVGNSSIRHGLIGFAIVMLQLDIAFDHLNCESVNIKVKQENTRAIKFNKRIGYEEKSKKEGFAYLQITPKSYALNKSKLIRYFKK